MSNIDPSDLISVIPGIGSVAASLIGNSKNVQLSREQREWDYKMWMRNNQYNTPAAQVKRLREAGLNPESITPFIMEIPGLRPASRSRLTCAAGVLY